MSRSDPGAASGGPVREPGRCVCGALEPLHTIVRPGQRGGCHATGCTRYEPTNVIRFPGAGTTPAPGPRPAPADLDAIGDRYTDLLEARERGDQAAADLLAHACADDVPALREEVHRVELLRRELAAELDRLTGVAR